MVDALYSLVIVELFISLMFQAEFLLDLVVVDDVSELQQVLEEYLPVLLGLIIKGTNFPSGSLLGSRKSCPNLFKFFLHRAQS